MNKSTLVLIIIMICVMTSPLLARQYHVTNSSDLHSAFEESFNDENQDSIFLAAGTYPVHMNFPPKNGGILYISAEPNLASSRVILTKTEDKDVILYFGNYTGDLVHINSLTFQGATGSAIRDNVGYGDYSLKITNCNFENNINTNRGGAIFVRPYNGANIEVEIWNCIFKNNSSPGEDGRQGRGGAIHIAAGYGSDPTNSIKLLIVNSLFTGNQANWTGGGLDIATSERGPNNNVDVAIINCTFADNVSNINNGSGEAGGGIRMYSDSNEVPCQIHAWLYNTIIFNNTFKFADEATQNFIFGADDNAITSITMRNCDIGDYKFDQIDNVQMSDCIDADPRFIDPAAGKYYLASYSPCIDKGTANIASPYELPLFDLLGNPRRFNNIPDIGAYEYVGAADVQNKRLDSNYYLLGAAPNPFLKDSKINFVLMQPSQVRAQVFDAAGRLVEEVNAGVMTEGWREIAIGRTLVQGVYQVRLSVDGITENIRTIKIQ